MNAEIHPSVKRLADVVGRPPDKPGEQDSWYSVYLGSDRQIPRVYTTRAHTLDLAWWHQQNGLVTDNDFGNRTSFSQYIEESPAGQYGIEVVHEMTVQYVNERTGFKAAVMMEMYDEDGFVGGWGHQVAHGVRAHANKIAEFLGFFNDKGVCELILPEGEFAIDDLDACGIWVATEINYNLLRQLNDDPKRLHDLTPRNFEKLISRLLLDLGFHIWLTPEQKDGGRDVIALSKLPTGTLLTLVECKKYREDRPVGVDVVRGVYGVMHQHRATNALIATTSRFTKGAIEFRDASRYQISLKDANDIANWLAKYK